MCFASLRQPFLHADKSTNQSARVVELCQALLIRLSGKSATLARWWKLFSDSIQGGNAQLLLGKLRISKVGNGS